MKVVSVLISALFFVVPRAHAQSREANVPAAPDSVAVDRRPPELRNRAQLGRAIARASRNVSNSGEVHVKLLIDVQGRVINVEVQKSSGFPGLDLAAVEAARTARFSPCTADGAPIQCWIGMPLVLSR